MNNHKVKLTDDLLHKIAARVNELMLENFDKQKAASPIDFEPSADFEHIVDDIFAGMRRKRSGKVLRALILAAAMIAMLISCALTVVSIRYSTNDTIFDRLSFFITPEYTDINVDKESSGEGEYDFEYLTEIETYYSPTYIPDGFELTESKIDNYFNILIFSNGDSLIIYHQAPLPDSITVNTEDAVTGETYINGIYCFYSIRDNGTEVVLFDDYYVY